MIYRRDRCVFTNPNGVFYPREFNSHKCRINPLFLRKYRGVRRRTWVALARRGILREGPV
jgi:hypothetical protein